MQAHSPEAPSLFVLETCLTVLAGLLAMTWPQFGAGVFCKIENSLGNLARRKKLAVAVAGMSMIFLRLAILPVVPIPQPYIHDEFSHLLAGDTFAMGRLTNPTHPLWIHFESFHIDQFPTYMSMYFPAQGMALAAGKLLFGHPWFGVLLAGGVMCSAICWMLQGWLPPGWAFFGAMIAVFRVGLFSYWVNSYYGGAVPAIGGCLLLGALPRLRQRFTTVDGIWLATGIAILANSRPFEGVLVTIPALAVLLRDWWKLERPIHWVRRAMIPALLLMAVAVGMLHYNQRVFGNPLTLAYTVNRGTYAMAPVFLWQKPRPEPVYHNPEMKSFYTGWEMEDFTYTQSLAGFFDRTVQKFGVTFVFVFGVLLMPPLIGIMRTVRDRRVSYLWKAGLIMGAGMCVNAWLFPHYIAPFIGGFYVLLVQSMRHVRMWKIATRPVGPALMRVMAISCILLAGIRLAAVPLGIRVERFPNMWYGNPAWGLERAAVQAKFQSMPGQHLAIVRYKKDHLAFDEWVYNAADIDHSKVVWAREFDAPRNAKLLEYFKGRQVWLVEPDEDQPEPRPYKPKLEHADVTAQHRVTSSHQ